MRNSIAKGRPFGDEKRQASTTELLGLESQATAGQAGPGRAPVEDSTRSGKSAPVPLPPPQISEAQRLDRLLLIMAIAYLLLCGVGLLAKQLHNPSAWCSTNRDKECSLFTIGLIMLSKIKASPPAALAAIIELSLEIAEGNWG